jgi:YVTN family beta-propeller protein
VFARAKHRTARLSGLLVAWNNGIRLSKTSLGSVQLDEIAPANSMSAGGTSTGSFAGHAALNAPLRAASAASLGACLGGGGGSVSSVAFNASASSITLRPISAYVADEGAGTVTPIDMATNTAETPITGLTNPFDIALTPNGANAYVTNFLGNTVTPINLVTDTAGNPITVGSDTVWDIAITPDGSTACVTTPEADTVTPINLTTNTAETRSPSATARAASPSRPTGPPCMWPMGEVTRSPRSAQPPTPPGPRSPSTLDRLPSP